MTSVEEARDRILECVECLSGRELSILDALNSVLDEDVYAATNIPHFDNSAMDGYAVRHADTVGASKESPVELKVVGDVAAGYLTDRRIGSGEAIRIMTGAQVPKGADAVIMQEYTECFERPGNSSFPAESTVSVFKEVSRGEHIREAGEDIHADEVVLKQGVKINPAAIGMLAAIGRSTIKVIRKPVVAVISTGDELVDIEESPAPGKIRNANAYSIAALLQQLGCIPQMLGIARDSSDDLATRIEKGLSADMIITTGGVSVGEYDIVKDVMAEMGEMMLWKIDMKPGKPLAFGLIKGKPVVGLPGNPTSAIVSFIQFVRPALLKMSGHVDLLPKKVEAVFEDKVKNRSGRRNYIRVMLRDDNGVFKACLSGSQQSGSLKPMVKADGLMIVPEGILEITPGEKVVVELL